MTQKRLLVVLLTALGSVIASVFGAPAVLSVFMLSYWTTLFLGYRKQGVYPAYDKPENITLLIPCYNDADGLQLSLSALFRQRYPHHINVVVVNDGSTDHTAEVIAQFDRTEYRTAGGGTFHVFGVHHEKNSGLKAHAITTALEFVPHTDGLVMILDADTALHEDAIENAMRYMVANPDMGAACGSVLPIKDGSFIRAIQYGEHASAFYGTTKTAEALSGRVAVMAGACSIHRLSAIAKVGGFNQWIVEDICWTWKARTMGVRIGYAQRCLAFTRSPDSLIWLWRQRRRWGRGRVEAFRAAMRQSKGAAIKQFLPIMIMAAGEVLSPFLWIYYLSVSPLHATALFAVMFTVSVVYGSEYVAVLRSYTPQSRFQAVINAACAGLLNTLVFSSTLAGFIDEFRGRKKSWLTNEVKGK